MKYLNGILTVIAICLVLITFAITGVIPSANAKEIQPRSVNIPVNSDGSINVKFVKGETVDVNIDEIGGRHQGSKTIDISIEDISGGTISGSVPVKIED